MNIDVLRTKEFYRSISETSLCECAYCRSYRMQIKAVFPEIAEYLDTFGIDIEKPYETSPLEPDENGMLKYCCCQYMAIGNCKLNYRHRIGDVEFRKATSYPRTGIEQEHFVLEFYPIELKFIKDGSI